MSQTPTPPDMAVLDAKTLATIELARQANALLEVGAAINAKQLGALLGIDAHTLHNGARSGRYPSRQPTGHGGARRFSPDDVKAIREAIARPAVNA